MAGSGDLSEHSLERNLALGASSGMLMRLVDTIADPSLVITWFVMTLTPSPIVIGLLMPIRKGGMHLPQLLVAGLVRRLQLKMPAWRALALIRMLCWSLLATMVFLLGTRDPSVLLPGFLAVYSIYWIVSGVSSVLNMDIVGKSIAGHRRGAYFAWANFGGGVLAMGASLLVHHVLDRGSGLVFPANYAFLFTVVAVAVALAALLYSQIQEPATEYDDAQAPLLPIHGLVRILQGDPNFQRFMAAWAVQHFAGVAAPFIVFFAKTELGMPDSLVGVLLAAQTLASVASALGWGWLCDRHGARLALLMSSVLITTGLAILLVAGGGLTYIMLVFLMVLLGVGIVGYEIAPLKFLLDAAPAPTRAFYVGSMNTVLGVVSVMYVLGGFIVRQWGLGAIFALSAASSLVAMGLLSRVREPGAVAQGSR